MCPGRATARIDAPAGAAEMQPMPRAFVPSRRLAARATVIALLTALTGSLAPRPCLAAPASAADRATAQSLFDSAMKLLEKKDFASACPQLEESQRLDPGQGTQYRLATCYEGLGKTASAWASYLEVAEAAKASKQADRERVARDRAKALAPKLPYLVIRAADADVRVTRDDKEIARGQLGVAVALDPGKHKIAATAPGRATFTREIESVPGATLTVEIPPLDPAPAPTAGSAPAAPASATTAASAPAPGPTASSGVGAPAPETAPPPPSGGLGTQRTIALAAGGVGVAAALGSVVFGALAKSKNDASADHCRAGNLCDSVGLDDRNQALSRARVATVLGVVGGVGVAGGVVLWVTAKPTSGANQASLRTNGTTLSFTRSF